VPVGLLEYVLVAMVLAVVVDVAYAAGHWAFTGRAIFPFRRLAALLDDLSDRRRPAPEPASTEQLSKDLRRLADERERLRNSDLPAKEARLLACTEAYDGILVRACEAAGVTPPPGRPPLRKAERTQAETALHEAGVRW
jgi:hypothetical protein